MDWSSTRKNNMELRHLRCFQVVAEELHFSRAAERLHIEQSPLSRTIKELEADLGTPLFVRTTRSTRLTRAGMLFKERVPRIFAALHQACDGAKAVASGFNGQLRIALSDGITPSGLPTLLARCREEEPETDIKLYEVTLSEQIAGLRDDLYDIGFAQSGDVGDGLIAEAVWAEELAVAVPSRHPLLAHKHLALEEVIRYPLVLCDPKAYEGQAMQVERILQRTGMEPLVAERVASLDLMIAMVSAGLALGLAGASYIAPSRAGVVMRPFAAPVPMLTTYLLRPDKAPSEALARFIARAQAVGSMDGFVGCGPSVRFQAAV